MFDSRPRFKYDIEVIFIEDITPRIRRITFKGELFGGIQQCKSAQWLKLFVPSASGVVTRAYTLRRHSPDSSSVDIDFVLHGEGAVGLWAQDAQIGETLGCSALRGGFQPLADAEWYLLVADETGTPAVMSILEGLGPGEYATAFLEAESAEEWQGVDSLAKVDCIWIYRNEYAPGTNMLLHAIGNATHPPGLGQFWIAAEASVAQEVREYLTEDCSIPRRLVRSKGYWMRGIADHRE